MMLKGKKAFCELMGTFFFILTISLASSDAGPFAPLAIGFMLMAQVFCFGYISGGHFNPAVTLGVVLIGQLKVRRACFYLLAQMIAALLAALVGWGLQDRPDSLNPPTPRVTEGELEYARAFFSEMIYTSCLVSVVLHVACSRQRDNQHYGLAIGMTVLASAFAAGPISGGGFNPAVATSLHLQKCLAGDCSNFGYIWIYWVAPLLGAGAAAFLFIVVTHLETEEKGVYLREQDELTKSTASIPPVAETAQT
jgi:MIP family channel proteins